MAQRISGRLQPRTRAKATGRVFGAAALLLASAASTASAQVSSEGSFDDALTLFNEGLMVAAVSVAEVSQSLSTQAGPSTDEAMQTLTALAADGGLLTVQNIETVGEIVRVSLRAAGAMAGEGGAQAAESGVIALDYALETFQGLQGMASETGQTLKEGSEVAVKPISHLAGEAALVLAMGLYLSGDQTAPMGYVLTAIGRELLDDEIISPPTQ